MDSLINIQSEKLVGINRDSISDAHWNSPTPSTSPMSSYLSSLHGIDYAALPVKVAPCSGGYLGLFHKGSFPQSPPTLFNQGTIAEIKVSAMLGVETEFARVSSSAPSSSPAPPYDELVIFLSRIPSDTLHPTTKLALLLSYIKMNKAGPHSPYVESLPKKYNTVSTSWRSEDIAVLCQSQKFRTKAFMKAISGRTMLLNAYYRISQGAAGLSLGGAGSRTDLAQLANYFTVGLPLEVWMWAMGGVLSRQNMVPFGAKQEQIIVLTPLWDMMNHSLDGGKCVDSSVVCVGSPSDGNFMLQCNQPKDKVYEDNEEVVMHYGDRENWQLLLYSGFALPSEVPESIELDLAIFDLEGAEASQFEKIKLKIAQNKFSASLDQGTAWSVVGWKTGQEEEALYLLYRIYNFGMIKNKDGLANVIRGEEESYGILGDGEVDKGKKAAFSAWLKSCFEKAEKELGLREASQDFRGRGGQWIEPEQWRSATGAWFKRRIEMLRTLLATLN